MRDITIFFTALLLFFSFSNASAQLDCSNATVASCGQNISVPDRSSMPNNVEAYSCTTWTETGNEMVYEYTPTYSGPIEIKISGFTPPSQGGADDIDVWLLESCDATTCLGSMFSDSVYYASGNAGQTYYIVIDSDNGSNVPCDLFIHCPSAPPCTIDITVSTTGESAAGANDGEAVASITGESGGGQSFNYFDINDNPVGSTPTVSMLAPGDYYGVVYETNDPTCRDTAYFTINPGSGGNPCNLAVTLDITDETAANADDGEATAVTTGAQGDVTYEWSNSETTETITGLEPGSYGVTVTDTAGCTASSSGTVDPFTGGNPCTLEVVVTGTDETANGASDGTATAVPSGAQGTVTYAWSNGETTDVITGLSPDIYFLTVTDTAGCTANGSYDVLEFGNAPCTIEATATSTAETAANANDGTATVSTTGEQGTVTYAWDNGETTDSISGLAPGAYMVTVTDTAGCTDVATVNVTAFGATPCSIDVSPTWEDETAANANDGIAIAVVAGSQGAYTTAWSNSGTTDTISGLSPGTYTVTVTDTAGCVDVGNVTISAFGGGPGPFDCLLFAGGIVFSTNEITPNGNNGTASALAVSPVNGGITYAWSNGASTALVGPLAPGVYTVTMSDAEGCSGTDTVEIYAFGEGPGGNDSCDFTIQVSSDNVSAIGATDGSAQVQVNGPSGTYTYAWSTGETGAVITGVAIGSYSVTVSDNSGCQRTGLANINNPDTLGEEPDGVELLQLDNSVNVYPNPASTEVNLVFDKDFEGRIGVYNSVGQQIVELNEQRVSGGSPVSIDLNGYTVGVYYFIVNDLSGGYLSKTFVVK